MPYEFNPLIPDGFQKKSAVTPADIARLDGEISDLQNTTTDLKQKKITKFFSANDYLEDNEIAQYQGEDDGVNNLQNGFFYKKNPAFTLSANGDSFTYIVGRKFNWYLRNNTLKVTQYYLESVQSEYNDFNFAYDSVRDVEVIFFAETYAKSPALKPAVRPNTLYYPFAIVSNQFDYNNPVEIINGDYYYKGAIINFNQSSGGVPAILCASMIAPYYRYFWLPVITRGGTWWWAAFLYETNSDNEFVILGVDNNLSAFDICRYEEENIVPASVINVQGYDLTENQVFSLSNTEPVADTTKAGLMSAADKIKLDSYMSQGFDFQKNGIQGNITLTERGCVCIRITTFMPITRDWFELSVPFTLVWGQVQYIPNTEFNSYAAILTTGNNFITFMLHPTNLAYTTFSVFFPAV